MQQPQKLNPFGFGVQNASKAKSTSDFGTRNQHQAKPFENKWTRSSSVTAGNSTRHNDASSQPSATIHKCTDPETCKRQISEDFQNEKPLWKLTCYGHCKNGPCDIVGDTSYEELRAAAYLEAKQGVPLESIIARENNLFNSKVIEFENLLHSPYVSLSNQSDKDSILLRGIVNQSFSPNQNNMPVSVSSFSQFGSSLNQSNPRPLSFGQPSSFNDFQVSPHRVVGAQSSSSGSPQLHGRLSSNGPIDSAKKSFPSSGISQMPGIFNDPNSFTNVSTQVIEGINSVITLPTIQSVDRGIWSKEEWEMGQIPEEPPPDDVL